MSGCLRRSTRTKSSRDAGALALDTFLGGPYSSAEEMQAFAFRCADEIFNYRLQYPISHRQQPDIYAFEVLFFANGCVIMERGCTFHARRRLPCTPG